MCTIPNALYDLGAVHSESIKWSACVSIYLMLLTVGLTDQQKTNIVRLPSMSGYSHYAKNSL